MVSGAPARQYQAVPQPARSGAAKQRRAPRERARTQEAGARGGMLAV